MPVRLALGGGGVRGAFHLGLLAALKERGVEVSAISGTSAGALAAAAFAFGLPLEPGPYLEAVKDPELLKLRRPGRLRAGAILLRSLRKPYLVPTHRIRKNLRALFGEARLEEAPIPVTLVAADLLTGEPVYLRRGPVVEAVLASGAIPGVFPPVRRGKRLLVDGDVVEKVPVFAVKETGEGPVVAVDVANPGPEPRPKNALEAMLTAAEASKRRLKALALAEAEVVVRPPLKRRVDTFELELADELYALGRRAGEELADRLRRTRGLGKAKGEEGD